MLSSGAVTMPPTIGAAIRDHDLGTGAAAPQDGQQARHHHRHRHRLRAHAQDRAFADGRQQRRLVVRLAGVEAALQRVVQVDLHHHPELRGHARRAR